MVYEIFYCIAIVVSLICSVVDGDSICLHPLFLFIGVVIAALTFIHQRIYDNDDDCYDDNNEKDSNPTEDDYLD